MNWEPFRLSPAGTRPDLTRSLDTNEGIGDRLRAAAFAEIQAREAFLWAASHFDDAPLSLRAAWKGLALAEQRHLDWLLNRMRELEIDVKERMVSDYLWISLISSRNAPEFAHFMASAEERGRKAGARFHQAMYKRDPITAKIFGKIAEEEVSHIALAYEYYPLPPKKL